MLVSVCWVSRFSDLALQLRGHFLALAACWKAAVQVGKREQNTRYLSSSRTGGVRTYRLLKRVTERNDCGFVARTRSGEERGRWNPQRPRLVPRATGEARNEIALGLSPGRSCTQPLLFRPFLTTQ